VLRDKSPPPPPHGLNKGRYAYSGGGGGVIVLNESFLVLGEDSHTLCLQPCLLETFLFDISGGNTGCCIVCRIYIMGNFSTFNVTCNTPVDKEDFLRNVQFASVWARGALNKSQQKSLLFLDLLHSPILDIQGLQSPDSRTGLSSSFDLTVSNSAPDHYSRY
jgi:hypothetical protein